MKPRRASLSPSELDAVQAGAPLPLAVVHYFTRVLRLGAGERVTLGDGEGRLLTGRLARGQPGWWLAEPRLGHGPDDTVPLVLLVGLLKPKRWSLVVEKCVELGVSRLVPLITERVQAPPAAGDVSGLLGRWRRIARAALDQCRRTTQTTIESPRGLAEALAESGDGPRILADPEARYGWPPQLADASGEVTRLLVGPEGGLTSGERRLAVESGYRPISLGGYPLRAETAAIALVAVARDRLGLSLREPREGPCR